MISKLLIGGLAALLHVGLVHGDGHVSCSWYPDGGYCTATVDSPSGKTFSAFQVQLAICAENNSGTGCTEELPNVCKEVPITGVGISACLPALGPDTLSPADAPTLQSIEPCVGDPSPQCNDIRSNFYDTLGCPQCTEAANEAVTIEKACIAASTKAECDAAGADAAKKPATAAPAPAPAAATPAAVAAPAPEPAAVSTDPVEAEAEGAAAPETDGDLVVEQDTSAAGACMAAGAAAIAGGTAAAVFAALV
eukprot:jgi/Ulvmu1/6907/UM031_0114.1